MNCNYKNLEIAFQKMENAWWETKKDLKWGYFFFDKNKESLLLLYKKLDKEWYVLENMWETDDSKDWVLWISKIETHTTKTLHERNRYFNSLAELFKIDSYDWWDVGLLWMK